MRPYVTKYQFIKDMDKIYFSPTLYNIYFIWLAFSIVETHTGLKTTMELCCLFEMNH
jgi:hypothetical protein